VNPLIKWGEWWESNHYSDLFINSMEVDEQNRLIKDTFNLYASILKSKGLVELQAIASFLIDLRENYKNQEDQADSKLDRLSSDVFFIRKAFRDTSEPDPELVERKEKLEYSFQLQHQIREQARQVRGQVEFRIIVLDRIFRRYTFHGNFLTIVEGYSRDALGNLHEDFPAITFWKSDDVRPELFEKLIEIEDFLSETSTQGGPLFWIGTKEQLVYLIWLLKEKKLISARNYWVASTDIFLKHDGSQFEPDSLRTTSGKLDLRGGGLPSTRWHEIQTIVSALVTE